MKTNSWRYSPPPPLLYPPRPFIQPPRPIIRPPQPLANPNFRPPFARFNQQILPLPQRTFQNLQYNINNVINPPAVVPDRSPSQEGTPTPSKKTIKNRKKNKRKRLRRKIKKIEEQSKLEQNQQQQQQQQNTSEQKSFEQKPLEEGQAEGTDQQVEKAKKKKKKKSKPQIMLTPEEIAKLPKLHELPPPPFPGKLKDADMSVLLPPPKKPKAKKKKPLSSAQSQYIQDYPQYANEYLSYLREMEKLYLFPFLLLFCPCHQTSIP